MQRPMLPTLFKGRKGEAMQHLIKLAALSIFSSIVLTVSPAHANLAAMVMPVPEIRIERNDLTVLESLKPIQAAIDEESVAEETVFETTLSDKLNQIRTLRHLMRSA
jgi:hypothetical protein